MDSKRIQIDTLRGIACILLISYHIIGSTPENGLRIESGMFREINDILAYLRMPLFTFLSGVVYAYRPFNNNSLKFISKKSRRLLLPMLTVGTTFAVLQSITPGTNSNINSWHLVHIIPVAHFWFIESLFILFLLIVMLEKLHVFSTKKGGFTIFTLTSLLYISPLKIDYFSISGFIYLTPFFLFGMAIERYKLLTKINPVIFSLIALTALLSYACIYFGYIEPKGKRSILGLTIGLLSCTTMYLSGLKIRTLAWIGTFSYSIYLYHVFFTAGTRILLERVFSADNYIIFSASLIATIFGTIYIEKIFEKSNATRILLLGKSRIKPNQ
ncbi:acyltransferase family protein, partial [Motilimonas sp. KMU-193]|uniref:acyltransferase family protein n=1 Tax=Motilimonas sp. KMU-193 TaxID=3388668 RepID=UPI00396AFD7A